MYEPNWDAFIALLIPNMMGIACAIPLRGQVSNKDGTAWFQTIKKPSWIIPDWAYGPVFVFMYSCLGYASYMVYVDSSGFVDNNELVPVALYGAQLMLSLVCCITLYKFHKYGYTMFLVFVLDLVLLALSISFYLINQYTAIFLVPIQAYTLYNNLLIHALWVLNKDSEEYVNLKV